MGEREKIIMLYLSLSLPQPICSIVMNYQENSVKERDVTMACDNILFHVWFQKVSILPPPPPPHPWKVTENSEGAGVLTGKLLEEKYEGKLEFPGG